MDALIIETEALRLPESNRALLAEPTAFLKQAPSLPDSGPQSNATLKSKFLSDRTHRTHPMPCPLAPPTSVGRWNPWPLAAHCATRSVDSLKRLFMTAFSVSFQALLLMLLGTVSAHADELPVFASDQKADSWLREKSPWYRSMAESVDQHGGYTISPASESPGGLAYFKGGRGYIELNAAIKGSHRVSLLIFEMTNLYQEPRHLEVTNRVRKGELTDPTVFWLLRETIEYDGLRLHRDVLMQLKSVLETIPPDMITWISRQATTHAEYQLPSVFDYIKAQEATSHKTHYLKLFEKHRAEYLQTQAPKAK